MVVVSQLYLLCPTTVTKTLFDGIHESMVLKDADGKAVIGGICFYEITVHKCVSIIYFTIGSEHQGHGYGNYLMMNFKGIDGDYVELMRKRKYELIAAQADIVSLNFYYKSGFIEFQTRRKIKHRLHGQLDEISDSERPRGARFKYKRYEPWLEYIEDYSSTILMVYKIPQNIEFKSLSEMAGKQKEGLLQMLSHMTYRNYQFERGRIEEILKKHRERF
jgi:hypothetical protein